MSLLIYAEASRTTSRDPFALADACPRGALVYAQFADLPALVREWESSPLKERYLQSVSFKQFQQGHLALKLLERWQEFDDALGFPLDASTLASAIGAGTAAVAVYDIGRLELVFVAPIGEEQLTAARFFQSADEFEKVELPDGTVYYSSEVAADGGRAKQKILFSAVRGKFVLATSEQLMLRTLANLNARTKKDRLSDTPSFKSLTARLRPHLATVWVDQSKLNEDWYFKHYWVMSKAARLAKISAGVFDFERREKSWFEHREFLLDEGTTQIVDEQESQAASTLPRLTPLAASDLRRISRMLPADAAYARLRLMGDDTADASLLLRDALLDRPPAQEEQSAAHVSDEGEPSGSFSDDYPSDESSYTYLGEEYDRSIRERAGDEEEADASDAPDSPQEIETAALDKLQQALRSARPLVGALAESPHASAPPLFVEFGRVGVLSLGSPERLDRRALEESLASLVAARLTLARADLSLQWKDEGEGRAGWRTLELPMLGWRLCYALAGRELIVANDSQLLSATLGFDERRAPGAEASASDRRTSAQSEEFSPDDLTIIRFRHREQSFNQVMSQLDAERLRLRWKERGRTEPGNPPGAPDVSAEFFSGNVASLLDVASAVNRVEIRRRTSARRLQVEIEIVLDPSS